MELSTRLAEICGSLPDTKGTSVGGGGGALSHNSDFTASSELARPDTPLTTDQCTALGTWGKHMLSRLRG